MSGGHKLLVIDDDLAIRRLLRAALERVGYSVTEAATARDGLLRVAGERPAAILLDLGLPDRDGLELVSELAGGSAALVVISAREGSEDKVTALDLGADDYITKPFNTEELLARVRAALRHRLPAGRKTIVLGEVTIDLERRLVHRAGHPVHLSPKEYAMLAELASHVGKVLTHGHLLGAVWGPAHRDDVEYLRVAARALRQKLEANPSQPTLLINEPGIGYRLSDAMLAT